MVSKSIRDSGGGGGSSAEFSRDLQTEISVNGALLHFFTFPKGGPGPLGPPLNRPLHHTCVYKCTRALRIGSYVTVGTHITNCVTVDTLFHGMSSSFNTTCYLDSLRVNIRLLPMVIDK